jgi:ketosteroid isomerase-like protein
MSERVDIDAETAEISEVIHNSIGWAATKDKELVFSCFADDPELFWFSPRDDGTVHGFRAFVDQTENFFMLGDFKAVSYEIRELQINLSRSGYVAWYHARLDDFNEWKGQPANWEDVRWTGVLEKRDGRWVIVQMHFSDASDKS